MRKVNNKRAELSWKAKVSITGSFLLASSTIIVALTYTFG
jgi:hypothetical protein